MGVANEGEDEMIFDDVSLRVKFISEKESNYHYTARFLQVQDTEVCDSCTLVTSVVV